MNCRLSNATRTSLRSPVPPRPAPAAETQGGTRRIEVAKKPALDSRLRRPPHQGSHSPRASGLHRFASEPTAVPVARARQARQLAPHAADACDGSVVLTMRNISGRIAYGPQAVPKSASVKDVKGFIFDPERRKALAWGENVLKDEQLLGDLGLLEEAEFTVCESLRDTATWEKASGILRNMRRKDVAELLANKKAVDIIRLVFHALFLTLSIANGEDAATKQVGIIPFRPERENQTFLIAKMELQVTGLRRLKEWSDIRTNMCRELLGSLPSIDYDVLQDRLKRGGEVVDELRRLMDIQNFTPSNSGKASGVAAGLHQWLEVSVKPFL